MAKFKKGQSGNPKGRPRRPPLPDKYRFEVACILVEEGCCPFRILADIALNSKYEKYRLEAASRLAGFVAPELKRIEHKNDEQAKAFNILFDINGLPLHGIKKPKP